MKIAATARMTARTIGLRWDFCVIAIAKPKTSMVERNCSRIRYQFGDLVSCLLFDGSNNVGKGVCADPSGRVFGPLCLGLVAWAAVGQGCVTRGDRSLAD